MGIFIDDDEPDRLDKVLDNRLAALRGEPLKWEIKDYRGRVIGLDDASNDVSVEYITKCWQEAGILDENGNLTNMVRTTYRRDETTGEPIEENIQQNTGVQ
ncbi:MAG: hypothetical protein ACI8WB_002525 [Phenylobacterium sp.]|jgi:hypothetical protein